MGVASRPVKRVQTTQHPAALTARCRHGAPRAVRFFSPPREITPIAECTVQPRAQPPLYMFFQVTALCKLFYVSCFAGGSTRPRPWFTLRWTIFHNFSCRLAHSQEDTASSYRIIAAHFDGPVSTICFSSPRALSRGHNIILPKIQTLAAHFELMNIFHNYSCRLAHSQEGPDHAAPHSVDCQVPSRCPTRPRPRPMPSHWPLARSWSLIDTAGGRCFMMLLPHMARNVSPKLRKSCNT